MKSDINRHKGLSPREKMLVYMLIYMVIFFGGLRFAIFPLLSNQSNILSNIETIEDANIQMNMNIRDLDTQKENLKNAEKKNKLLKEEYSQYVENEDIEKDFISKASNLSITKFVIHNDEEVALQETMVDESVFKIVVKNIELELNGNVSDIAQFISKLNSLNGCHIMGFEYDSGLLENSISFELAYFMMENKK